MSKRVLTILSAITMSFCFAETAKADCDGIYLGVRGGAFKANMGSSKETTGTGNRFNIGEYVYSVSGAIGYRYEYFRFELEGILRGDTEKDKTNSVTGIIESESFESKSYMFNVFWDLSPYTMFTPYLMAGAGISDLSYTKKFNTSQDPMGYDETNFTWTVGGGLSAKVTSRFNIDVGYRYFDMGKIAKASIHAHEIYGGLRYVF
ncbi:MAG: outer membrane beta-barrel protein [Alphaproteobacteria bacterium]|nr:outer membrane beta-barrel protein [Alphaproteobacteria bacterium]